MTYRGHATVGGAPGVHELAQLIVTKVAVGPFDNNATCSAAGPPATSS